MTKVISSLAYIARATARSLQTSDLTLCRRLPLPQGVERCSEGRKFQVKTLRPHELLPITEPTIFACAGISAVMNMDFAHPGADYTECRPNFDEIFGLSKFLNRLFGNRQVHSKPPHVYSVGTSDLLGNKIALSLSNRFKNYASHDATVFAEGVILPLLAKNLEIQPDGSVKGTPYSKEQIIKNLSNITLYGHSYGSSLYAQVGRVVRRHMYDLNIPREHHNLLLNSIVNIGTGSVTNTITQGGDPLNTLHFLNPDDSAVRQRVPNIDQFAPPRKAPNINIYYTDINTTVVWFPPVGDNYHVIRNGEWQYVSDPHSLQAYASPSMDFFRSMGLRSALLNAAERTGPITARKMLTPRTNDILPAFDQPEDPSPTFPHIPTLKELAPAAELVLAEASQASHYRPGSKKGLPCNYK